MKKLLAVAGLVMLIAANCNNSTVVQQPANSPTPTVTPAPTPSPTPTPNPAPVDTATVQITSLTPSVGPAGVLVTIKGRGFTPKGNEILLGDKPSTSHHLDKTPANMIVSANSADGATLSFKFPLTGPSGIICDPNNHCVGISAMLLQGEQKISVSNSKGLSNAATFTLTK